MFEEEILWTLIGLLSGILLGKSSSKEAKLGEILGIIFVVGVVGVLDYYDSKLVSFWEFGQLMLVGYVPGRLVGVVASGEGGCGDRD